PTAALEPRDAVTGKVDLADRGGRQGSEIFRGLPAMVGCADINIVDIAQDPATGVQRDGGEKFPFWDRRMAEAQIRCRFLDKNPALQIVLRLIDMPADGRKRLFGQRQGQQVSEVDPTGDAPREVLGDQCRLDPLHYPKNAVKMARVEPLAAAQRQPYTMK